MWYYSFEKQQVGPLDEEAIKGLIADQTIIGSTLVWTQGMATWLPASSTSLAKNLPQVALPTVAGANTPPVYSTVYKTPEMEVKELNDLFLWFWICLAGSLVTFGLSAIASMVLFYIILYRHWQLIQDGYARTTPGKAVGFLFIPFFNLYWIFEAFPGLIRDTNAYIQRHALPIKMQDAGLATAFCILTLLCLVPYLNFATGVALLVIQIILAKNLRDSAIALIQNRK
ncbi:MAG: hypothetical protein CVU42_03515 [Chloroflexi bacterium HGW-Chloroflexi-4]|jgi:hypothetical protein|nr:MAG: hypothetical protein CVU42_03515 [Chloroflexi bacterium HGW-Chloroflexi-4]